MEGTGPASEPSAGGIFPRTRWSIVLSAKDSRHSGSPAALEELCVIYWRPVYLFIRGRGHDPGEAEDLTQEFFYRLLDGHYLGKIEGPELGRLRSFLCVVLKRFLYDEHDKRMTRKRGGDWKAIPIDSHAAEASMSAAGLDHDSPEKSFDRQWAIEVLGEAMKALRADYHAAGKEDLFEALKPTISPQLEGVPYARLATDLGMSEGALKVAVHRLRQRYRQCLHDALRDTLQDPADTQDEVRYLLSLFARG